VLSSSSTSAHHRRIRTTNLLEHFNQEVKRRTRVIRIFPNPESVIRLISALAIEECEDGLQKDLILI